MMPFLFLNAHTQKLLAYKLTNMKRFLRVLLLVFIGWSCNNSKETSDNKGDSASNNLSQSYIEKNLAGYAKVRLTTDLSKLTEKEKQPEEISTIGIYA